MREVSDARFLKKRLHNTHRSLSKIQKKKRKNEKKKDERKKPEEDERDKKNPGIY